MTMSVKICFTWLGAKGRKATGFVTVQTMRWGIVDGSCQGSYEVRVLRFCVAHCERISLTSPDADFAEGWLLKS